MPFSQFSDSRKLPALGSVLAAVLVIALLGVIWPGVLWAGYSGALAQAGPQDDPGGQGPITQTPAEVEARLAGILEEITLSEQRKEQLRAEMEQMEGDRNRQNAALIAAGQRIRLVETEISDIEKRLGILLESESRILARLESSSAEISNLLAALQRISKNPPPALIIDPSDALSSARSASILSLVLPDMRQRAEIIVADLNQLEATKNRVLEERQQLSERFSSLLEEQLRIATLIEARKLGMARVGDDLAAEEALAGQLAREATSLGELVETLKQRIASISEAAEAADAADSLQSADGLVPDPEAVLAALADTNRTSPAIPFISARGYLTIPAAGVVVNEFGDNDGFGGISQGVSIVTRADAQVVSPADGWVMYKGPYLNYGQIIILNPGNDHTILLAGLETVDVELGQFVLMGEPVGSMGSRTVGRTIATSAGVLQPTLYIEFRNQDKALDPAPWWAESPVQNQAQAQLQSG